MANSKFFTNNKDTSKSLFDKFQGLIQDMANLSSFHAVVGYFRSSGYFKIRNEFQKRDTVPKIQILIGINIDNIFRNHDKNMIFFKGGQVDEEAREQYREDFISDVKDAGYHKDIEKGILMLADDLQSGQVELKIHPTKNLHAKFYLFLPQRHTEHSDGWVIMGSSNLSDSGMGLTESPRYELNVAMKDYDDVAYCKNEFDKLWADGIDISYEDIQEYKKQTHLGQNPTPYELYIKLLIDYFGERIEDDFTLEVPKGFKNLKYQKDAVSQGYQMLINYNGFFLADVVGLGKTVVATMIAKRFIEENGARNTRILIVYPPALEKNWKETFNTFNIARHANFISCGSLDYILEGKKGYPSAEAYDLVIVDETHRFRGDTSQMYDALQRICKADRDFIGNVGDVHKKVMLISATPLNNRPDDLYNLLMLFQDKRRCNIDGISNLQNYFAPKIAEYKELMSTRQQTVDVSKIQNLYEDIRNKVIDKVTVRRTRENIVNYAEYKKDLEEQGIIFPQIAAPREVGYILDDGLKSLFDETVLILEDRLNYARYKAIDFLIPEIKKEKYPNAAATTSTLTAIYRTHMIKRLESSFFALKASLGNLRRATQGMIDMFLADQVIIAPDLKVKELQGKGLELDDIIEKGIEKLGMTKSDFVYPASAFDPSFITDLQQDIITLDNLIVQWDNIDDDPKLDRFVEYLETKVFDCNENPTGKLVVFSESKDTIKYLTKKLAERLNRKDILSVSSDNRSKQFETIQANFDANYLGKKKDKYNILISTDVLAEGVNLHRANVIVNYDTPWNASRLMQRIGRVNRIGSVAGTIVNYMFYPSAEGDEKIRLYKNALVKLQGFHSAYGEDSQIYSSEEIVEHFELFNANVKDDVDKSLELLRVLRDFRCSNPEEYQRIKQLPIKSRTGRSIKESAKVISANSSLVYIASPYKNEFYIVEDGKAHEKSFLDIIDLFEAKPEERPYDLPDTHYEQVGKAFYKFNSDVNDKKDKPVKFTASEKDNITDAALFILREVSRDGSNAEVRRNSDILANYVELGTYSQLTRELSKLGRLRNKRKIEISDIETTITNFVVKYHKREIKIKKQQENDITRVIISETFI